MEKCDMCGSEIHDSKCSCGVWVYKEEMLDNPMKKSLEAFHEMKQMTLTCDSPHLGCAMIFFRGDYNDCVKVKKYIYEIKKRPGYLE